MSTRRALAPRPVSPSKSCASCQPVDPFPDFRPQRLRARAIRAPSNSSVCVTGVPAKRGHRFSPPGKTRCPPDHAGWLTVKQRASTSLKEGACDRGRSHSRHPRADRRGDRPGVSCERMTRARRSAACHTCMVGADRVRPRRSSPAASCASQQHETLLEPRFAELKATTDPVARLLGAVWSFSDHPHRVPATVTDFAAAPPPCGASCPTCGDRRTASAWGGTRRGTQELLRSWFLSTPRPSRRADARPTQTTHRLEDRVGAGVGLPAGLNDLGRPPDGDRFLRAALTMGGEFVVNGTVGRRPADRQMGQTSPTPGQAKAGAPRGAWRGAPE